MRRNRIRNWSSIAMEILFSFAVLDGRKFEWPAAPGNQREKRRFPELQGMKPRGKSPWSPVSHQPHDDAHPASSVTSTRESRATPSGFPSCFLSLLPATPHPPKPFLRTEDYSYLSATIGSTRIALRAGSKRQRGRLPLARWPLPGRSQDHRAVLRKHVDKHTGERQASGEATRTPIPTSRIV